MKPAMIKKFMSVFNLTTGELGSFLLVDSRTIKRWLDGKSYPSNMNTALINGFLEFIEENPELEQPMIDEVNKSIYKGGFLRLFGRAILTFFDVKFER